MLKALRQNCAAARVAVGQGQSFSKLLPVFDMYLSQIVKYICLTSQAVFFQIPKCIFFQLKHIFCQIAECICVN